MKPRAGQNLKQQYSRLQKCLFITTKVCTTRYIKGKVVTGNRLLPLLLTVPLKRSTLGLQQAEFLRRSPLPSHPLPSTGERCCYGDVCFAPTPLPQTLLARLGGTESEGVRESERASEREGEGRLHE